MLTAILIDGVFFLKRFSGIYTQCDFSDPITVARTMHKMACYHLNDRKGSQIHDLYRIFFYDCPPLTKKGQYPISKRAFDFPKHRRRNFALLCTPKSKSFEK